MLVWTRRNYKRNQYFSPRFSRNSRPRRIYRYSDSNRRTDVSHRCKRHYCIWNFQACMLIVMSRVNAKTIKKHSGRFYIRNGFKVKNSFLLAIEKKSKTPIQAFGSWINRFHIRRSKKRTKMKFKEINSLLINFGTHKDQSRDDE